MKSSSIFPFTSSTASLTSGNSVDSGSNMDLGPSRRPMVPPPKGPAVAKPRRKKPLTKSMERFLLGFEVLMIVLFAIFVRYDPEQADALTISQMHKNAHPTPPLPLSLPGQEGTPSGGLPPPGRVGVPGIPGPQLPVPAYPFPASGSGGFLGPQPPPPNDPPARQLYYAYLEQERIARQSILHYDSMYQDVHVMIFVGFGFLMTFLKRYGYSAVGLTMLLSAVAIQWSILCRGIFHHDEHGMINIEITSLINADFAAGAVLISLGGVLGVSSPFQLLVMVILEVFLYALNEYIGAELFSAIDVGGSMFIHAFGAYFGLALSRMMKPTKEINLTSEGATKTSDLFAMIGTIFLWIYWPSFNGALASGDDQHRAVLNTLLSLTASLLMTFIWSGILSHENKLDMVHIQNATLAGGVAVGAVADLMIRPFGALIIGSLAGTVSTLGYVYLTPWLKSKLGLHDTCGIHNLHGMPGVMGGIAGTIMAALANEEVYGNSLYQQYPARAPLLNSSELSEIRSEFIDVEAGENRSAGHQALYQLGALGVTMAIAILGGSVTGLILRAPIFDSVPGDQHFDDTYFWEVPEDEEKITLVDGKKKGLDNRTFDFEMGVDPDTKNDASQKL